MGIAVSLAAHLLAALIWVGGMFFAYMILRPAAGCLTDAPDRLRLWSGVFRRFFAWVRAAVIVLPLTGYVILFGSYGGMKAAGIHIHIMHGLGWLMILLFLFLNFGPVRALHQQVETTDWAAAADSLASIRRVVAINLALGLTVTVVAALGRFSI